MKLKLDENGNVVLADGKPVYIHDDGKEIPFDAGAAMQKIAQLNGEAKSHREAREAAEALAKKFEGIEDPAAALKALQTIKNLDDKKLIDAGEAEKVKAELAAAYEGRLKGKEDELTKLQGQLYNELIGGSFARSKTVAEKLAIPADIAQSFFGQRFKVEDGKVVAYDSNGSKLYSRVKPGELAGFDEALETLIDSYPHKDSILKSTGSSGSGSGGNAGGGSSSGAKSLADCKTDAERVAYLQAHAK
ncbi:DUF6651 domain-containing protein [Chromobacterium violaceum]|uniref:DUF6651 domain-containing protein n=1 Tax=Chromobacterium violaceum TaxID=536 RepID=UPI0009DAE275|nr:DUF6651 domain-containing protein [Chromobacterium violaceum]OQS10072.1 hypothetical protein B0T38_10905 [Chromobacterium violaceum]OQS26487.1 hypothetical protein B0T37_10510 [Chromobacterium violaceum]QRO33971.1 hypothetical protein I6K04_04300 [Chromobacterium violaceum]QRQ16226.1 hypothetical protein I6K03_18430 [Chromobacterium violaceum]